MTPEGDVKKEIQEYLKDLMDKGLLYWDRLNSGKVMGMKRGYRNRMTLCRPGTADLFILCKGKIIFLEIKAPGEKPRDNQIGFASNVEYHGAYYYSVDSLDEAKDVIERWLR